MARTQTSPLTVKLQYLPGGTDDQGDYEAEWDLISVEAEERNPRCGSCGDPTLPIPPVVLQPDEALNLDLSEALEQSYGQLGTPICDACAVREEISNTGVYEMFVEGRDIQAPDYEAIWILKGIYIWDCYTDYEGCTECDTEFEFKSEEFVKKEVAMDEATNTITRLAVVEALNTFDAPEGIYVRELVDGKWTHSLSELPGDKAVAHTIRLLRRVLLGVEFTRD